MQQEMDELRIWKEEENFNLKKWVLRMLRAWPLFLLSFLICFSLAYLYLRYTNPVYKAVASLVVKDEKKGEDLMYSSALSEIGLGGTVNKLVENEIEKLKSYDLMEDVVDTLRLFVSVKLAGRVKDAVVFGDEIPFNIEIINPEAINKIIHWKITYKGTEVFFHGENKEPFLIQYGQILNSDGIKFRCFPAAGNDKPSAPGVNKGTDYKVDIGPPVEMTMLYSKKLSVEAATKFATVINLEMKDGNQKRAAAILETLIDIYNRQGLEDKNRVTDNTISFLSDRLSAVADELRGVEGSVQKLKQNNKLTDLSSDAQQYVTSSQQVDAQKAQSQTRLNIINALEQNLQQNQDNPELVPSTLGIDEPSLGQLVAKHNELVLEKERVQEKSGVNNPLVVNINNQIRKLRGELLINVRNLKQAYTISLNDISRKDAQLNNQIRNVPQLEKNLVQITRNRNVQEQLYSFLLQKSEEAAVIRASNIADSRTIVKARSLGAISPKRQLVWLFSILMSIMMPVTIISLKDFMDHRVGDISQVKQNTSLPLLGIISHVKKLKTSVVISPHSRSLVSEQIRNIRTSINFLGKEKEVKTVLVTSFQPGDGKSFVSLNLAAGYALMNKKTLMLECDLRRPHIAKELGLDTEKGISNVLTGQLSLDDVVVEINEFEGNLSVIPAGNLAGNAAELISGKKMSDMMKILQERFDRIIINTPPISLVADASLLQQYADITLIVVRQDHTSREIYTALKNRTAEHPDDPIYLLLNDVGKNKRYRGGHGHGGYEYGYGYGYSKKYYYEEK